MNLIGYGICGPGEADKYLEATLEEFKRVGCDDVIILLNHAGAAEKKLIKKFGYKTVVDDREWGLNQNKIKEDFVINHISKLNPDWCLALDMDEVLDSRFTKDSIRELSKIGDAFHFFICDLWNDGWKSKSSFWNVRLWQWKPELGFAFKPTPLHCGLAPMWAYHHLYFSPYILKHYGLKDKKIRDVKIARYEKYDPEKQYLDRKYYDMLKSDVCEPFDEEAVKNQITKEILTIKQKPKTMAIEKKKQEYVFMITKDGRRLDVPKDKVDLYLKQGMVLEENSKVVSKVIEAPKAVINPLECGICGWMAANKTELAKHKKQDHRE